MKIKEISFKNTATPHWELEKMKFSDLTLLVGASGVGKTQILYSLMKLIAISNGSVYNGVEWDLHFTGDHDENYRWTGQFENSKGGLPPDSPILLKEELYLENELVFTREESNVKYEGKESPKISQSISVLNLFTEEKKILPIKMDFGKVVFLDYQAERMAEIPADMVKELEIVPQIEKEKLFNKFNAISWGIFPESELKKMSPLEIFPLIIIMLTHRLIIKLFLTQHYFIEIFERICADFKDIFPHVEDIRFHLSEDKKFNMLQIKEHGTDWISLREISSGMFKTLMHLVEFNLTANGSVILIDEFENSLGVNCIDAVADSLLNPGRKLQYIITSHHPYIINNIDMKYWKVVTRKGSKVFSKNADELKLGKSKHEAFKQLLNLAEFSEGIS